MKLNAQQRRFIYLAALAIGAASLVLGVITEEHIFAFIAAIPLLTQALAALKAADPIAVVGPNGDPVAGDASPLPNKTPVSVLKVDQYAGDFKSDAAHHGD